MNKLIIPGALALLLAGAAAAAPGLDAPPPYGGDAEAVQAEPPARKLPQKGAQEDMSIAPTQADMERPAATAKLVRFRRRTMTSAPKLKRCVIRTTMSPNTSSHRVRPKFPIASKTRLIVRSIRRPARIRAVRLARRNSLSLAGRFEPLSRLL